jgi:hypothetical protein
MNIEQIKLKAKLMIERRKKWEKYFKENNIPWDDKIIYLPLSEKLVKNFVDSVKGNN